MFSSGLQLFVRDLKYESVFHRINTDCVSILDQSDRATDLGFRYNMPDAESVGSVQVVLGKESDQVDGGLPSTESSIS